MSRLLTSNGSQLFLFPSSFDCWLPQNHNVRFFDELIEEMDLSGIAKTIDLTHRRGRPAYDRVMLTKIVLYGYTVGIASARELEKACVERLDLRFLTGNRCPKYRSIARFKKRHLKALAGLHEQVLLIAAAKGLIEMKEVAIDGTKMLADASKHKAMSYQYMCNREIELRSEIKSLEKEKNTGSRAARKEIKDEIEFKKARLNHISKWKQALIDRVREEGREEPEPKEQINFTDDESRIMRVEKQFEQAYNAQAAVDKQSQIVLVALVTQNHNDKQLLETMLDRVAGTIGILPDYVLADSGYFSEEQILRVQEKYKSTQFLVPPDRQQHGEKVIAIRGRIPKNISTADRMRRKLKTKTGKAIYAHRKTTVEPVFGQIKEANLDFRQFSYRGLEDAQNEFGVICIAHNLLKIIRHRQRETTKLRLAA
ncbi:MAG: transposase [Nitrososphaera sp.]|nr:transposase [Nitrososphaera sp.]